MQNPGHRPSLDELRLERRTAALAVHRWGEKFRPIFERMDREVRERERIEEDLQRAIDEAPPGRSDQ